MFFKNNPSLKKNKDALKTTLKYKQQISIFNTENFEKEVTIDEFYDIIYRLDYSSDGKTLFCMNIPHLKVQNGNNRQTYINIIDAESGQPLRKGFISLAAYEPDFKLSNDGKFFGLISQSNKFIELHIYDFETGKMLYRFELSYRLYEKNDGDFIMADSRASFVFLPDNKSVLVTMGNRLVLWKIDSNHE